MNDDQTHAQRSTPHRDLRSAEKMRTDENQEYARARFQKRLKIIFYTIDSIVKGRKKERPFSASLVFFLSSRVLFSGNPIFVRFEETIELMFSLRKKRGTKHSPRGRGNNSGHL
jgi:hypothetical protein